MTSKNSRLYRLVGSLMSTDTDFVTLYCTLFRNEIPNYEDLVVCSNLDQNALDLMGLTEDDQFFIVMLEDDFYADGKDLARLFLYSFGHGISIQSICNQFDDQYDLIDFLQRNIIL